MSTGDHFNHVRRRPDEPSREAHDVLDRPLPGPPPARRARRPCPHGHAASTARPRLAVRQIVATMARPALHLSWSRAACSRRSEPPHRARPSCAVTAPADVCVVLPNPRTKVDTKARNRCGLKLVASGIDINGASRRSSPTTFGAVIATLPTNRWHLPPGPRLPGWSDRIGRASGCPRRALTHRYRPRRERARDVDNIVRSSDRSLSQSALLFEFD